LTGLAAIRIKGYRYRSFGQKTNNETTGTVFLYSVADPDLESGIFLLLDRGSGSGMNIPDHSSRSLQIIFWVKIIKFFDADLDPGSKMEKFGSGMEKKKIQEKHIILFHSVCIV
jgi:hypothetical protein